MTSSTYTSASSPPPTSLTTSHSAFENILGAPFGSWLTNPTPGHPRSGSIESGAAGRGECEFPEADMKNLHILQADPFRPEQQSSQPAVPPFGVRLSIDTISPYKFHSTWMVPAIKSESKRQTQPSPPPSFSTTSSPSCRRPTRLKIATILKRVTSSGAKTSST